MENFKKSSVTFFAQQIQSDNIYHQNAWEISYLMVYLVALQKCIPGSTLILPTVLITGKVFAKSYVAWISGFWRKKTCPSEEILSQQNYMFKKAIVIPVNLRIPTYIIQDYIARFILDKYGVVKTRQFTSIAITVA